LALRVLPDPQALRAFRAPRASEEKLGLRESKVPRASEATMEFRVAKASVERLASRALKASRELRVCADCPVPMETRVLMV
jgi:hypothetical protein